MTYLVYALCVLCVLPLASIIVLIVFQEFFVSRGWITRDDGIEHGWGWY